MQQSKIITFHLNLHQLDENKSNKSDIKTMSNINK